MERPLEGYRVLDLGQIYVGGYSGLLLSYLGADVIKVEPPGGDNLRARSDEGETVEVQFLNATKRGLELDLKAEEGKRALKDLVRESDVLLENFAPGVMENLGVGYEELKQVNPQLVYAHGSGYGDDGPYSEYRAMDLTVQAMGGIMDQTGFPDREPLKCGIAVADMMAGTHLVAGIVSAVVKRERTGEGEYVEVGMFDAIYPALVSSIAIMVDGKDVPPRTGNRHSGHSVAPYNVYEATDGHVALACVTERQWNDLLEVMGRADLQGDDRFDSKVARSEHIDDVDEIVEGWTADRERDEIVEGLTEIGIPVAPVQGIEEIVDDPHLRHRSMLHELPNKQSKGADEIPVTGMPIKLAGTDEPDVSPSPSLGEHSEEVLSTVAGYSTAEIESLRERDVI